MVSLAPADCAALLRPFATHWGGAAGAALGARAAQHDAEQRSEDDAAARRVAGLLAAATGGAVTAQSLQRFVTDTKAQHDDGIVSGSTKCNYSSDDEDRDDHLIDTDAERAVARRDDPLATQQAQHASVVVVEGSSAASSHATTGRKVVALREMKHLADGCCVLAVTYVAGRPSPRQPRQSDPRRPNKKRTTGVEGSWRLSATRCEPGAQTLSLALKPEQLPSLDWALVPAALLQTARLLDGDLSCPALRQTHADPHATA